MKEGGGVLHRCRLIWWSGPRCEPPAVRAGQQGGTDVCNSAQETHKNINKEKKKENPPAQQHRKLHGFTGAAAAAYGG